MFHLIGFTFIFIIFLLIFGLVAIVSIARTLLSFFIGKGRKSSSNSRAYTYTSSSGDDQSDSSHSSTHKSSSSSQPHKKLFDDDEGDYVEFEEV
jgi:hypothetical protein